MQFAVAVSRLARVIAALVPALLSLVLPLQSLRTGSSIRPLHSPERSNGERTPIRNVSCKVQLLQNSYKTFALNIFFSFLGIFREISSARIYKSRRCESRRNPYASLTTRALRYLAMQGYALHDISHFFRCKSRFSDLSIISS